ncbi:sporulation inhibitor of replication protein SirA [Piscibacillus sp. B03]|uniref:sporulation inhibitor of replication protein SirA n=1 Tax=Piscibacillus sp. B03 TaxID=3457430 RepID=UPI003FCD5D18
MYQYSLYLVKSGYAQHFYYKIDTVYRFLYEQMIENPDNEAQGQYKLVLDKANAKDLFLHLNYWADPKFTIEHKHNQIIISYQNQSVLIKVNEYYMTIFAETIVDLDQLLFQYLKTFHPHLFVVNYETYECGWITPFVGKHIYSL